MRHLRWTVGLIATLLLPGCGGDSTPTTPATPAPTPTPCTQSTVLQVNGAVPAFAGGSVQFTTTAAGRLDITVDWTFAATPLGVYLFNADSCSEDQFPDACTFLIRSETTVKPRKVSLPNAAARSYELLVVNYSDTDESVSGQVVLSSPTCPAFVGTGPSASLRRFGSRLLQSPLH
jgi:hypothetical protein